MYAVILKEGSEYVIIDAYYKGRWRCDVSALRAFLAYLAAFDKFAPNSVPLDSITGLGEELGLEESYVASMVDLFEREHMPRYGNFDAMYLARRLTTLDEGIITPPNSIIEVTPYCNYNCDWCYIPPRTRSRADFYSLTQLRSNVVVPPRPRRCSGLRCSVRVEDRTEAGFAGRARL